MIHMHWEHCTNTHVCIDQAQVCTYNFIPHIHVQTHNNSILPSSLSGLDEQGQPSLDSAPCHTSSGFPGRGRQATADGGGREVVEVGGQEE